MSIYELYTTILIYIYIYIYIDIYMFKRKMSSMIPQPPCVTRLIQERASITDQRTLRHSEVAMFQDV